MTTDDALASLGGFVQRGTALRLLALQRVLAFDSFVSSLHDLHPESWIGTAVRCEDVAPFVQQWRDFVDAIHRDAIEIGDSELTRFAAQLADRREPVAAILGWPNRPGARTVLGQPGEDIPSLREPLQQPSVQDIITGAVNRLEVLVRRSRRLVAAVLIGGAVLTLSIAVVIGSR